MRRRLLSICSALSLLLFVTVVVLWVRSECGTEWITVKRTTASGTWMDFSVCSMNGGVMLRWLSETGANPPAALELNHSFDDRQERSWSYPYEGGTGKLGFQFGNSRYPSAAGGTSREVLVVLPYCAPALLFVLPPMIWAIRWLRRLQRARTLTGPRGFNVVQTAAAEEHSDSAS